MKIIRLFSFTLLLTCLLNIVVYSQEDLSLTDKIPVDGKVKIGQLDNGLKYYIRQNSKPEQRVEMRLAVNAGSLCENEKEQGLAHFTEHMCFNGTEHFEKNELVDVLERMGMKFGGDVNAYTSFAETVYKLHIPTDKPELVDKGLQILEDWSHLVSMTGEEIDKERGVIIEEWRMGLGADDRMRKKAFPVIFKGSMYAERIPIGKKDILETFEHETIRGFYKKWYRPELQAIIIVGDIDVDEMEKKIIAQFGSIKNPENAPERKLYEIPNNDEPLISIETDPEATQNMAMFFYKHPKKEMSTIEDYRQSLVEGLYNGMLNARLNELSQKPECPYIFAQTSYGQFLARNLDAYTSYGMMKENQIDKGIEAIMTENQRVKQHGFTATELERMKKDMLQRYEKAAKEADKTPSKRLADQYVSNYLTQEPIPSVKTEFKLAQKLVPEIKLEEINKLANEWITDNNFVMMVTAPEKEGVEVPTKEDILNIIEKVKKVKLEPYIDDVSDAPLLKDMPVGSKVTATKENEELGFTELTLGNGIRVVLMPTDFKNDEILMSAYSYGGTSHASDEDILDATFSFAIVQQCGVGEFSSTQLEKKLQGKDVEVMPVITDTDEGFRGSCAPKDLETMLQLTFLYCTNPRVDKEAFDSFISKMKNQMKFLGSSPMMVFQDTLTKVMSSNSPRAIAVPKTEQLDKIDMNKAFEFYNDRYSDAGDFNFFFVGNFDVEELKPLLEKYLGGLPSKNRKESYLDKSPKFPEGIKDVTVHKGMDEKSIVAIVMDGEFDYNYTSKLHIKVMTQILNIKLREYLREEESGVYGVQIMEQISQYPKPRYKLIVYFPCSPKNAKKLTKTVFREMEKIMAEGPTDDDLAKVKETLTREHEENLKENKYWLRTLEGKYFNNESFDNFNKYTEDIKAITKEEIQQAAKKYITPEHYVRVVLMPEKK